MSDPWKMPITSTPAPEPMCPACGRPTYEFHGAACPWSWRSQMIIVDDPVEPDSQASRETREAVMSAPTVDEFAEAVRELLEYADGMSLKTGVRFDKLLLRHELGKPEPDQAAVKRLTEEIAFAENYGKQD